MSLLAFVPCHLVGLFRCEKLLRLLHTYTTMSKKETLYGICDTVKVIGDKSFQTLRVLFHYGYIPLIIYWGLKTTDRSALEALVPPAA